MKGFVLEQPLVSLQKGDGDAFARKLVQNWTLSDGYLSKAFCDGLDLDRLVLLDVPQINSPSPAILYCGREALAGKLIGQSWMEQRTKAEAFRHEFRALIGRNYNKAYKTDKPVFDIVSAPTVVNGQPYDFMYERLILPVKTLAGATLLYCYSFAPNVSLRRLDPTRPDKFRRDQFPQNTHLASPLAPEELATQFLVDRQ